MQTIIHFKHAKCAFDIINANQSRLFLKMNLILFKNNSPQNQIHPFLDELRRFTRKTDILFEASPQHVGILLIESHDKEAHALCDRLFAQPFFQANELTIKTCSLNIRTNQYSFEQIVKRGMQLLEEAPESDSFIVNNDFNTLPTTKIKISIIVSEPLFSHALQYALEALYVPHFEFDIQVFEDGSSFLTSDFYYSAHQHFILLDDILPRQNGMEILYYIRELPNARKFTIFMMSDRQSEEHATLAYENGIDQYLLKPINHQLLMALVKRSVQRLWD